MISQQTLKGNLVLQDYTTAFTLNQGDKGVPFRIELLDNGTPYTLLDSDTVSIEWLKPNGNPFLQEGDILYGATYIEFTTPEAIAQYSGSGSFNIIISNSDVRKGTIRREYKVVPTSMKPGSVSEDVITDAITELRELSVDIANTVQNNQDLINNNQAATKQDISNINSSLEEKTNYSNRIYKPRFERVIQTAYVDNDYNSTLKKTHDEIKTELENMKNSGVEYLQLVFPIGIKTSDGSNTLFVSASDNDYKDTYNYIVSICNNIGLKISTLKIHCHETNRVLTLDRIKNTCGIESFKTQYLSLIKEIYNNYKTYTNKVIILNEQDYFYLGSIYVDFCNTCIDALQVLGAKVSISTIQPFAINKMDSTVIDNLDFLSSNYYPPLSRNGLNATYSSMVNRMINANDYKYGISKMLSYNKPIYISEFGGQDIEESLDKPWIWSFTDNTTKGGKVQDIFLNIICDLLNDNRIDGLAYWWELDTSLNDKIHEMTGVIDNE